MRTERQRARERVRACVCAFLSRRVMLFDDSDGEKTDFKGEIH